MPTESANAPPHRAISAHSMTTVRRYGFLLAATLPTLPVMAYAASQIVGGGGWFAFWPLVALFVLIPTVDALIGRDPTSPPVEDVPRLERDRWYPSIVLLFVPLQIASVVFGAWVFANGELLWFEQLAWAASIGVVGGVAAINVAHELVHKDTRLQRAAGGVLLSTVNYASFKVEHVRGHHVHVGTPKDPSSARYNQSIYSFLSAALRHNVVNAWRLEATRLAGKGHGAWSWRNELLGWWALTALFVLALIWAFGTTGIVFFVIQSFVACSQLEVVNYIEHYGLRRRQRDNGRYEPVSSAHSWESNHLLTGLLLLHLPRHADHHLHANRPYQVLRYHEESPQMPCGYAAMFWLALCPPLWRRVMNPRVDAYQAKLAENR